MGQLNKQEDWVLKHIQDEIKKECTICKEEKPHNIFWDFGPDNCFYICKDCEYIIRGLYLDVVLEISERDKKPVDSVIDDFRNHVHKVINMREKNSKR